MDDFLEMFVFSIRTLALPPAATKVTRQLRPMKDDASALLKWDCWWLSEFQTMRNVPASLLGLPTEHEAHCVHYIYGDATEHKWRCVSVNRHPKVSSLVAACEKKQILVERWQVGHKSTSRCTISSRLTILLRIMRDSPSALVIIAPDPT